MTRPVEHWTWVGLDERGFAMTNGIPLEATSRREITRQAQELAKEHGCATYRLSGFRPA